MKQEASKRMGVMTPSHAIAESKIEPANAIDRATIPTIRRSNISAIAPAGVDTSATGEPFNRMPRVREGGTPGAKLTRLFGVSRR